MDCIDKRILRPIILTMALFISVKSFCQDIEMTSYEQNWSDDEGTLTLKNNTSSEINNISFRIIYLAMNGVQLDYRDYSENVNIDAGMTRRVDIPAFEHRREYCYYTSNGLPTSTRFKIQFIELEVDSTNTEDTSAQLSDDTEDTFDDDADNDTVRLIADKMPSFKGNVNARLAQHLQYPAIAAKNGAEGKVIIRFVVGKNGSVRRAEVVRSIYPALDREALRAVYSMPKLNPRTKDGYPVSVWFTLPVTFKLQ